MCYYYSAKNNCFVHEIMLNSYDRDFIGDAIKVSDETWKEYTVNYIDKRRIAGKDGMPSWEDVDNAISPEKTRNILIKQADDIISPMLGYALSGILSDTEKETFKAWNEYRKALEDIDVTATDIEWPDKPK